MPDLIRGEMASLDISHISRPKNILSGPENILANPPSVL